MRLWIRRGGGSAFLKPAQFACRRHKDGKNFLAGDLGHRIEKAQGFQFVAEELKAHRPGAGEWIQIENAAAQSQLAFLGYLGLRLVTLLLKPFNQVKRIDLIAPRKRAGAGSESVARECAL